MSLEEDTAEALRLASVGRGRVLTDEEFKLLEGIAARSGPCHAAWRTIADGSSGSPVIDFWCALLADTCEADVAHRNVKRLHPLITSHIVRCCAPAFDAMRRQEP